MTKPSLKNIVWQNCIKPRVIYLVHEQRSVAFVRRWICLFISSYFVFYLPFYCDIRRTSSDRLIRPPNECRWLWQFDRNGTTISFLFLQTTAKFVVLNSRDYSVFMSVYYCHSWFIAEFRAVIDRVKSSKCKQCTSAAQAKQIRRINVFFCSMKTEFFSNKSAKKNGLFCEWVALVRPQLRRKFPHETKERKSRHNKRFRIRSTRTPAVAASCTPYWFPCQRLTSNRW